MSFNKDLENAFQKARRSKSPKVVFATLILKDYPQYSRVSLESMYYRMRPKKVST
jgi:hypothetical protein